MTRQFSSLTLFGEVLFDCFPGGELVLGGAPFNVAWHAQALGDQPRFISRIGDDLLGQRILAAMQAWGLDSAGIQVDPRHPTGRVDVRFENHEPSYQIVPDCAYDFIADVADNAPTGCGILYHGSLCLRNSVSRNAFNRLAQNQNLAIFLDINLRAPWWRKAEVFGWMERARWVKLNQDELKLLGFTAADIRREMARLQTQFAVEQLILTRGELGGLVRTASGEFHHVAPDPSQALVDTVGAGDAFTAIYLHGILAGWSVPETLAAAQRFAGKVVSIRGATTSDADFYHDFIRSTTQGSRS